MSDYCPKLKLVKAKLPNGCKAWFVIDNYPLDALTSAISDTNALLSSPVEIFRNQPHSTVIRKDINIANKTISVVIKQEKPRKNLAGYIHALRPAKAFHFLQTVSTLNAEKIPTVKPLAAIQKSSGIFTTASILITEYAEQSNDLYWFMRKNKCSFAMKKAMSAQIARIFASLHKLGLWHRDAKAQNFLVTRLDKDHSVKLSLIDLDGIKSYGIKTEASRFRPFAKLAATLLSFGDINRTDYLRTVRIYCKLTDIDTKRKKQIFRQIAKQAIAIRLLTMAKSAAASVEKNRT